MYVHVCMYEGAQMIAPCVRPVKTMIGEPGDALCLRELKAGGRNVEFPTTETEETRGPAWLLSGETTLRANDWRFATRQNEACRQEPFYREGPEKDAQACLKAQRSRGLVKSLVARLELLQGRERKKLKCCWGGWTRLFDLPLVEKHSRERK